MKRAIKAATKAASGLEKVCPKCKQLAKFSAHSGRRDGMQVHCVECMRKYHNANRARQAEKDKAYRAANRDRERAVKSAYWHANKESLVEYHSDYYAANRSRITERKWRAMLANKYGITEAEYAEQLLRQGGMCPLCGDPARNHGDRRGAVDHCHDTGEIRGILCGPCNVGLHRIERDVSWGDRAIAYIKAGGIWRKSE